MVCKVGGGQDDKKIAECWQLMELGGVCRVHYTILFTIHMFEIFYNKNLSVKNKLQTNPMVSLSLIF